MKSLLASYAVFDGRSVGMSGTAFKVTLGSEAFDVDSLSKARVACNLINRKGYDLRLAVDLAGINF